MDSPEEMRRKEVAALHLKISHQRNKLDWYKEELDLYKAKLEEAHKINLDLNRQNHKLYQILTDLADKLAS